MRRRKRDAEWCRGSSATTYDATIILAKEIGARVAGVEP
jgi:hypothetical protein